MVGRSPWPHSGIRRCCNSMSGRRCGTNPAAKTSGSSKTELCLTQPTSTSTFSSESFVEGHLPLIAFGAQLVTIQSGSKSSLLLCLGIYWGLSLRHSIGIDSRTTAGPGGCCSNHSNGDAAQRCSKCTHMRQGLYQGFRWPLQASPLVDVKTPTLSFLVLFLGLQYSENFPRYVVFLRCSWRVKPCRAVYLCLVTYQVDEKQGACSELSATDGRTEAGKI